MLSFLHLVGGFNMTREEAVVKFNNVLTIRNLAKHTLTMYEMYLNHFFDWLDIEDVSGIDLSDAQNYTLMMLERGDAPSSINTCLCALRYFFEAVLSKVYTRKQFPHLKFSEDIPYLFSKEEIKELLNTDDIRIKLIILLGIDCGFRASETAHIRIGDVDVSKMLLTIPNSKRGRTRKVKLSKAVLETLRSYFKEYGDSNNWNNDDYLFKRYSQRYSGSPISTATVHKWFRDYIKEKSFYSEKISYHDLRHSFATNMLENGCDIFLLKKLLGHSSLTSTSRYIHYTTTDIENSFSLSDTFGF